MVAIEWRPFLLRPDAPEEGWMLPEQIKRQMQSPNNPLRARAKALGLVMREDRARIPSSRRAHEATEYARSRGKQDAFHHSVLQRYWTNGEDLHEWSTLRGAAVEADLDPEELQAEVSAGTWRPAVEAFLREASQRQVSSVPTFIISERYAVPGAQNAETFRQIFKKLGATPLAIPDSSQK